MHSTRRQACIAAFAGAALAILMPRHALAQDEAVQDGGHNGGQALTDAYNASGLALFKQLSGSPGNIVLSPFSIGTAMAMALSGARGETEREMAGVLEQRLDRTAIEAANATLMSALHRYDQSAVPPKCPPGMQASGPHCEAALRPDGQCTFPARREGQICVAPGSFPPSARLLAANALMLTRSGDLIAKDYAALLKDKYGAEVFQNAGLDDVNGWVKRKTEGKIEQILGRLDPSSPAVILNAVYFKAQWAVPFAKAETMKETFNLSRQRQISVPMMRRKLTYALVTRPGYRAIRLPYEVAPLGMVIVLPNEIDGLDAVSHRLDDNEWAPLAAALHSPEAATPVDLALPRFKASFEANLAPLFREAGMTRAFDPKQADFSGMTGRPPAQVPLAIGAIVHRAVIDVMEDGTEAAAATAIAMVSASLRQPPNEQPFHVDRPFLFAILDDASGAVLFQGRILDPR